MKKIKIAYIGGGSKLWARTFMNDLALTKGLGGEIALYDIDEEAAIRNQKIGNIINQNEKTKSKFKYTVAPKIEVALKKADFVIISILPGTFDEMHVDVHAPEKYGVYQSVGDTVGPGGVIRAMRTIPQYEFFAKKIKEVCPNAWVLNFTNPMSMCVKALYDNFKEIKVFGCCHEVFHAQKFLGLVLEKTKGIESTRKDIQIDACGINHFTWITEAKYKDIDLLSLLPEFMDKYYEEGYYEYGTDRYSWKTNTFHYGNKVKMDLFRRYGVLGAAGDRHLVEFLDNNWYMKDPKMVDEYCFRLTTVPLRKERQKRQIAEQMELIEGKKEMVLAQSREEAVDLMKALLGFDVVVSNVNMPNMGQMRGVAEGVIVETNCIFSTDSIKPIVAKDLPINVLNLVNRNALNIEATYEGIIERNLEKIFNAFVNEPLCSSLTLTDARKLFKEMIIGTRKYLDPYFKDIDSF